MDKIIFFPFKVCIIDVINGQAGPGRYNRPSVEMALGLKPPGSYAPSGPIIPACPCIVL